MGLGKVRQETQKGAEEEEKSLRLVPAQRVQPTGDVYMHVCAAWTRSLSPLAVDHIGP